jgi:excisionase family DNA binding protein
VASVQEQREQLQRAKTARSAAIELQDYLDSLPPRESEVKVILAGGSGERSFVLPRAALDRTIEVLKSLGDGQAPSVLPMVKELSTGDVASLLGVSRQYVVRLIDDGRLPSRKVGNRRRVRVDEALRYLREDNRRRAQRLRDEMAETG